MIEPGCRVVLAAMLAAPTAAFALADTYTRMSVSMSQLYDANLFATPAARGPQADLISRAGPSLEVGYLSLPLDIVARYDIQAERYLRHPDLAANAAHQDARLVVRYAPMPRIEAGLDAGYVATQTPAELNLGSQLAVGRAPAERLAMTSTAAYHWSDAIRLSGDYAFGRDRVEGAMSNTTQRLRVGLQRRTGTRNTYRAEYQLQRAGFGDGSSSMSFVAMAAWAHSFTPRTAFEISAGPRLTAGSVRPEVSAALRRQLSRWKLSADYTITEQTTIGESGTVEVNRVLLSASYRPKRRVALTAAPSLTRSSRDRKQVSVFAIDIESALEATRRLSVVVWGRIGRQDGTLSGPPGTIPYRTLGLRLTITQARREGRDAASASPRP